MDIQIDIAIAAPPSAVWRVVGEHFANVSAWAEPIEASSCAHAEVEPAVGVVRACRIAGFGPVRPGTVEEKLTTYDSSARTLAYEAVAGLPRFLARARNRWEIAPDGASGSRVSTWMTLDLRGPMRLFSPLMTWKLRGDARRVLEDLRHYVEQGRPSPRKREALRRARR